MKSFAAALLVLVASCGKGKAIFNVDVYSFMAGSGKENIPYTIPPGLSGSASTFQRILLPPGFGGSIVDSVKITTGNANLNNTGGSGTIGFEIFFASDSAGTITTPDTALSIPATAVSGVQTVPVAIAGDLSPAVNSLFANDTLWMRVTATGTNPGLTPVTGQGVLTALVIRVVLQDKIF
jgi:hypothetical protein